MDKTTDSLFAFGRQLARDNDAMGLERAMSTYVGIARQEVLDGWFEGALERAVEVYAQQLRAVPYDKRNAVIETVTTITRQHSR